MFRILMIVCFCLSSLTYIYPKSVDCPPSDSCNNWSNFTDTLSLTLWDDVSAIVHYRVQKCNGVVRFVIDSTLALDNGNFLDSFSIYHFEINNFKSLLEITLLNNLVSYDSSIVPFCGSDTITTVQFYSSACGVWLKCSYKVDTLTKICDYGWS